MFLFKFYYSVGCNHNFFIFFCFYINETPCELNQVMSRACFFSTKSS